MKFIVRKNKKVKVAVICDNKEQYNSYMKSHKDCNQCEYIYDTHIREWRRGKERDYKSII